RQRLPLRLETRNHRTRVHAQLNDLERDVAPHRLGLLRQVNRPTATLADSLQHLITPNASAFFKRDTCRSGGCVARRVSEEAADRSVDGQEFLDITAQLRIAFARAR